MKNQIRDLNLLLQEMNALSNKVNHTPQEKRKFAYLQTAIASLRSGASLEDVDHEYFSAERRRLGLEVTAKDPFSTRDQRAEARGWKSFLETRSAMTEGDPASRIGSYTGLGTFVPTGYFPSLFAALGAHDALFNEEDCTVVKTTNGRPITVPVLGDIEEVATIVGEAGSQSVVNYSTTGQGVCGVYTYNGKRIEVSIEAFDDAAEALSIIDITKQVFASRLSRGIGADLLTGDGTDKPLGLLAALSNLGLNPITATGSANVTGGAENGSNSLGPQDFANALAALDSAYLESDKVAWLLNKKTLGYLNSLVTKQGSMLELVKYVDGQPFIYGIPCKISPSMPDISASATPVVLGDLRYWMTRLVMDDNSGLMVYREGVNLVEKGVVGLGCFVRAGGCLLYSDTNSPSPFVVLQNFS
jgi:HK97 family phage major capsid protein